MSFIRRRSRRRCSSPSPAASAIADPGRLGGGHPGDAIGEPIGGRLSRISGRPVALQLGTVLTMTNGSVTIGNRPLVGLLYSSAAPGVIDAAGDLVESLDIIPERLFHDLGPQHRRRFHRVDGAVAELRRHAAGRHTSGHGTGLSLPSDGPLDENLLDVIDDLASTFDFAWYSEHLSGFATIRGAVPSAQAGLGLPVPYDEDVLRAAHRQGGSGSEPSSGCGLLLENPAVFTPVPGCDYREPEFLNELVRRTGCGVLLDLHNLSVNERNNQHGLRRLPRSCSTSENIVEVHIAGGTELFGVSTDSHAALTPPRVWELATDYLPEHDVAAQRDRRVPRVERRPHRRVDHRRRARTDPRGRRRHPDRRAACPPQARPSRPSGTAPSGTGRETCRGTAPSGTGRETCHGTAPSGVREGAVAPSPGGAGRACSPPPEAECGAAAPRNSPERSDTRSERETLIRCAGRPRARCGRRATRVAGRRAAP